MLLHTTLPTSTQTTPELKVIWDPAVASVMTLAGNPETNDVNFKAFGDGVADLVANGLFDTAIDTGDAVTLFELTTGETLSSVDTPCPDPTG